MQSQDSADTTNSDYRLVLKTQGVEDLFLNSAEIDTALRKLSRFFEGRVEFADRETIGFCLSHIFYNVNQLYTLFLPTLTNYSQGDTEPGAEQPSMYTFPMRNMPTKNITLQYSIWSLLREIEAILERLEPLCRLVISAITTMLSDLDRTCSIEESGALDANQRQARQDESEEWQWGLVLAQEKMSAWLKHNEARLSFSAQFAILVPMIPAILRIDDALDALLKSACTIFGDILPDFRADGRNEDEQATMLLLDIIQHCDQILLQIGMLGEPVHVLMGQYILETPME